jgi:uncharacterized protein YjbI with pentapeptide repeats
MANCRFHEMCGLDADENSGDGLCILHSENPEKDNQDFDKALAEHIRVRGDDFRYFVFPREANFTDAVFAQQADFSNAVFAKGADFTDATFEGEANFEYSAFAELATFSAAEFTKSANFSGTAFAEGASFCSATFSGRVHFKLAGFGNEANFSYAKFSYMAKRDTVGDGSVVDDAEAIFWLTTFNKWAEFKGARFEEDAYFSGAKFKEGADFSGASFGKRTSFLGSTFLGRTSFVSGQDEGQTSQIFSDVEVDFRKTIVEPLDSLTFRDADLRKCRFLGTDLRKAEITGATWLKVGERSGVYDEIAPLAANENREWHHIERLYRELKQNFEERRDYERARDFHYGEKEARRRQAKRFSGLWLWLNLYKWVAGYGERYGRPLLWAVGLMVVSAGLYLCLGLRPKTGDQTFLNVASAWDWLRSGFYSLRVMTLLKPEDLEPYRYAKLVHAFESLAGPVLIGLFALALRQRLKR